MDYTVKQGRFEGPYTKLLSLIEDRKLSITEINLGSLADDYISYIRKQEEKDHADMSLFIVVASTLMLIKVKSLLPKMDYGSVEEKQIKDLTQKLILFAHLVKVVKLLKSSLKPKKIFFSYGKVRIKKRDNSMPKNVTKELLVKCGLELLVRGEKMNFIREITIRKRTSIEEVTHLIRTLEKEKFSLREVSELVTGEGALILSFISLLELVRAGEITASQETHEDIFIIKSTMLQ